MRGNNGIQLLNSNLTSPKRHSEIAPGLRLCLVSAPTATDFDTPDLAESEYIKLLAEHAPVGILSLAAVLEREGTYSQIIDLNEWYYQYLRSRDDSVDFCAFAGDKLQDYSFDVIGFSTICSSYPLTLRIAECVKRANPASFVVLGGPQASVVDEATMRSFPFIDCIVRGEAEETFPAVLAALGSFADLEDIRGITFRRGEDVIRTPNAHVIEDLDSLPLPAFHLCPHLKASRYIPLELGRGCPFACTFCSTNDFFRRNFRLKSPHTMIEQMKAVKDAYQIQTFDLIHDMFTVDRKRVVAFCEALLASGEAFYWNCSARTDCIDEALVELMESAGCRGIFFGIETGSERMQVLINKRLDLPEAMRMVECNDGYRIRTAVSLISGFPDENREDLQDTVSFFVDSLRYDYAEPQFHIMAPLAATPIEVKYRDQLSFDNVISDMSYQGWRQAPPDLDLIRAHPDIFPNFYAVPTPGLDRQHLKELRDFLLNGAVRFRWLLIALHQETGDLMSIFDQWRVWREHLDAPTSASSDYRPYYSSLEFRSDFLRFIKEEIHAKSYPENLAIAAILDYESEIHDDSSSAEPSQTVTPQDRRKPINSNSIPITAQSIKVKHVNRDYKTLVEQLRRKKPLTDGSRQGVTLAVRRAPSGRLDIIQLSDMSAEIVSMCNGTRSVKTISDEFSSKWPGIDGIPPDKACLFGLEMLRAEGLIDVLPALDQEATSLNA